jgi:hypothetical protein
MKPLTYPLKLQMNCAEVGDQALVFLGLTTVDEEKSNQRFGASTRAAARRYRLIGSAIKSNPSILRRLGFAWFLPHPCNLQKRIRN